MRPPMRCFSTGKALDFLAAGFLRVAVLIGSPFASAHTLN
jgi:hypothetical protein